MAAMLSPSWNAPLFTAPSPKKATATRSLFKSMKLYAGPRCLKDARSDDAAGSHHADVGGEEMHAAAAPLRAAGGTAEELGKQAAGREPLGEGMPMAAVGAEDDVFLPEMCANARGDRLLPDVRVAGAVNEPALMRARQLLFATADQHHRSIKGQQLGLVQVGECFGEHDAVRARQRLAGESAFRVMPWSISV